MQREKPSQELFADVEKLRYPTLLSAGVYTLRIGDLQPNSYSSDDKDKYISLDAFLDVTISAAQYSQNQRNTIHTKKHIN